ncbi:MAG: Rpn family recombination-promoting nuclease/putative transposase [Lachnospiraceae bacterium]|nr:Rpn family recombination-promoting nuclease/putative transposase [Lachnospiraceae bacterium]
MERNQEIKLVEYVLPIYDDAFKMLFGDYRDTSLLKAFLQAVINLKNDELDTITIMDPHMLRFWKKDKRGILDIKARTKSGYYVNVEMQKRYLSYMAERVKFYRSGQFNEQVVAGGRYEELTKVITVLVVGFRLFTEDTAYKHCFFHYDVEHQTKWPDLGEIYVLELDKCPKQSDGTKLWDWMCFFSAKTKEEFEMIAKRNPDVAKAVEKLSLFSLGRKGRRIYREMQIAKWDKIYQDRYIREEGTRKGLKEGLEQGLEQGVRRGRNEIRTELIQKKLTKGQTPEAIADALEESVETINEIIASLR